MAALPMRKGSTITFRDGSKAIILKAGRGLVRSLFIYQEDGTTKLLLEADYWRHQGLFEVTARKASNIKFARDYCSRTITPEV